MSHRVDGFKAAHQKTGKQHRYEKKRFQSGEKESLQNVDSYTELKSQYRIQQHTSLIKKALSLHPRNLSGKDQGYIFQSFCKETV